MKKILYEKFDQMSLGDDYYRYLVDKVNSLGFDISIVKRYIEEDYRCSHRYFDYIEVYVETDNDSIESALKIIQ